ncbi:MAG: hypothetical protein WCI55_13980 [Armatimonadota bacterium]
MPKRITFRTAKFDVNQEPRNNDFDTPSHGESIFRWLGQHVTPDFKISGIATEEVGWAATIHWKGIQYMMHSCVSGEDEGDTGLDREWQLLFEKVRSFKQILTFTNRLQTNDECFQHVLSLLKQEPDFRDILGEH